MRQIEGREWWLWGFAVAVTLALTLGIVSFTFPWFHWQSDASYWFDLSEWVRGLAALVLLFDLYTVYQHFQLHRIRRQLAERDQLFQLISENAADMIALVDSEGRRLYNSPAYQKGAGVFSGRPERRLRRLNRFIPDDRPRSVAGGGKSQAQADGASGWNTASGIKMARGDAGIDSQRNPNAKGANRKAGHREPRHYRA